LGLRPISLSWTKSHIQAANTLVTAAFEVFKDTISQLEATIIAVKEQEEARKLAERSDVSREDA
jgi:hypothetical protein